MRAAVGYWSLDRGVGALRPRELRKVIEALGYEVDYDVHVESTGKDGYVRRWLWSDQSKLRGLRASSLLDIACDARIDNRKYLGRCIGQKHTRTEVADDAEVILASYRHWGENCPLHLVGDYAFAIWDPDTCRLFLARDHLGVKPLYYYWSGACFAFATKIKALLEFSAVARDIDEPEIGRYLTEADQDRDSTFYRSIKRLPPGHSLSVTKDGFRMRQYWSADQISESRFSTPGKYAERFAELFTESVRCRISEAKKAGSLLSGGLDSSSIGCVANSLSPRPIHTFSLIFDSVPESDEREYMQAVIESGNFSAHFLPGDQLNPYDWLDKALYELAEPFSTPNLFLNCQLYEAASRHGVDVLLDGFLGDNVVSHGSYYLTELAFRGSWIALLRECQEVSRTRSSSNATVWRLLRRFAIRPVAIEPARRLVGRFTKDPLRELSPIINKDFAKSLRLEERVKSEVSAKAPRTEREAHARELSSGALSGALENAYGMASAYGVDLRFPYSDRRLVEFCLSVPAREKCKNGRTRVYAREGLRPYLPKKVYERLGKANLSHNFRRSVLELGRKELDEMVFDRMTIATPYIDMDLLQKLYAKVLHRAETTISGIDSMLLPIWKAVVLARWLEVRKEISDHNSN